MSKTLPLELWGSILRFIPRYKDVISLLITNKRLLEFIRSGRANNIFPSIPRCFFEQTNHSILMPGQWEVSRMISQGKSFDVVGDVGSGKTTSIILSIKTLYEMGKVVLVLVPPKLLDLMAVSLSKMGLFIKDNPKESVVYINHSGYYKDVDYAGYSVVILSSRDQDKVSRMVDEVGIDWFLGDESISINSDKPFNRGVYHDITNKHKPTGEVINFQPMWRKPTIQYRYKIPNSPTSYPKILRKKSKHVVMFTGDYKELKRVRDIIKEAELYKGRKVVCFTQGAKQAYTRLLKYVEKGESTISIISAGSRTPGYNLQFCNFIIYTRAVHYNYYYQSLGRVFRRGNRFKVISVTFVCRDGDLFDYKANVYYHKAGAVRLRRKDRERIKVLKEKEFGHRSAYLIESIESTGLIGDEAIELAMV